MTEDLLRPLLLEMQKNNAFQKQLLAKKVEDDTPKQLLAGNLFEIINDRLLHRSVVKELNDIEREAQSGSATDIAKVLVGGKGESGTFLKAINESDSIVNSQLERMIRGLELVVEASAKVGQILMQQFSLGLAVSKGEVLTLKDYSQIEEKNTEDLAKIMAKSMQTTIPLGPQDFGPTIPKDVTPKEKEDESEGTKPASAKKEDKKEEKSLFQNLSESFTNPIGKLQDGFSKIAEKFTIGNTVTASILTATVLIFMDFFPKFRDFVRDTIIGFKNILTLNFSEMTEGQVKGIIYTTLFFMRNLIIGGLIKHGPKLIMKAGPIINGMWLGLLTRFAIAIKTAGKFFLAGGPIGIIAKLILGALAFFAEDIIKGIKEKGLGGFFMDIIKGLKNMVLKGISAIGSIFSSNDVEGKYMGGPVAAGTPYMVGEKGPELFVPSTSGGIMANGMGGATIINNNMVSQSNNASHNHQHSNISITDSQQDITGL